MENDIKLHENTFVHSGIYKIKNHTVTFPIISSERQEVNLCLDMDAIFTDVKSFETSEVDLCAGHISSGGGVESN